MENLEQYWEQSFFTIGRKFAEVRPNYQDMGETDSMVAALYWLFQRSLFAFPRILYIMCTISHTQHEDRKANRKSEGWGC